MTERRRNLLGVGIVIAFVWAGIVAPIRAQMPQDAKAFLAWHDGLPPTNFEALSVGDWAEVADRAYGYLSAGAVGEAEPWIATMERLDPGNPDAERYRLALLDWNPRHHAQSLAGYERWLKAHPIQNESVKQFMQRRLDFLQKEQARREELSASRWRVVVAPLVGVALLIGWVFLLRPQS